MKTMKRKKKRTANEILFRHKSSLRKAYIKATDSAWIRQDGTGLRDKYLKELGPCHLSTRSVGEKGKTPYPVLTITVKKKKLRVYAHHVVVMHDALEMWDTKKMQVSHECHRPSCLNRNHLRLLPKKENQEKSNMSCIGAALCSVCGLEMILCTHRTPCLTAVVSTCSRCTE